VPYLQYQIQSTSNRCNSTERKERQNWYWFDVTQASYLVKVLESLKLTRTASTLRQEAKLIIKPNISEEVAKIKESTAEDHNKQKELIHRYFTNYLKKLIRENCISEALKIF
jgi:hypothetical protein